MAKAVVCLALLLCASLSSASAAGRLGSTENLQDPLEQYSSHHRNLLTWTGFGHPYGKNWWYGHHRWYGQPAAGSPPSPSSANPSPPTSSPSPPDKSPTEPGDNSSPSSTPAWTCGRMEPNANYKGTPVDTVPDASGPRECCAACKANQRCNVWVFCNQDGGCDDGSGTMYDKGRCELKLQDGYDFIAGDAPYAYSRGPDTDWVSGTVYMPLSRSVGASPPVAREPQSSPTSEASTSLNVAPSGPSPAGQQSQSSPNWWSGLRRLGYPTPPSSPPDQSSETQQAPGTARPPPEQPREPQPAQNGSGSPPASSDSTRRSATCDAQTPLFQNALYGGLILNRSESATALGCCRLCLDEARCNSWSWCDSSTSGPDEGCSSSASPGQSYFPDRTCLLKTQPRLNSNPEADPTVLLEGEDVSWTSGLSIVRGMD